MKNSLFLYLISLVLFVSCKKDQFLQLTFSGSVTDAHGNAVANATITLSNYHQGNVLSGGGYYQIAKARTDNNGYFKAAFNCDSVCDKLMVQVFADNYYPYEENMFFNDIQNNILSLTPVVYRLATIKISFKNTEPVSPTDEFSVFQANEVFGPSIYTFIERQYTGGTYNDLESTYTGSNIQGYELAKTKGDTYTVINWTSKKNGIVKYVIDSVFIAGGAEGSYEVDY